MFVFVFLLVFIFTFVLQRSFLMYEGVAKWHYDFCVIKSLTLSMFVFVFVLLFVFVFALQRCNPSVRGCGEVDYGLLTSSSGVEV